MVESIDPHYKKNIMSNIKINYHQLVGPDVDSPFSLDGVGFEPELMLNNVSKESVYWRCPAWKHKASRTFILRSPVDLTLTVDLENKTLNSPNVTQWQFDKYCNPTFLNNWCSEEKVTIQLTIPRFMFWTNHKNVWIESRPHFSTPIRNNLTAIPGWYNLSSWTRPLGAAFDVIDPSKPIIINRGDPLLEVCFYSKNLNDGIILKKSYPSKNVKDKMDKISLIKEYVRGVSNTLMFKEQKSKCPFDFMWKK